MSTSHYPEHDLKNLTGALFRTFLTIGAFTFGGGWAMIPLIRTEVLEKRRWVTFTEFVDSLAVAQSAPGSIAVNIAAFMGYRIAGLAGMIAATLGAVLPSFLVILALASAFTRVEANEWVMRFFSGVRPAVFALIALSAWELGVSVLREWRSIALAVAALILVLVLHVHPSLVLLGGVVAGVLLFRGQVKWQVAEAAAARGDQE
ncbi:MAG: chromate transporter [Bacillota bacterium]|nr:chromate transporter [Bacillota bacterium]